VWRGRRQHLDSGARGSFRSSRCAFNPEGFHEQGLILGAEALTRYFRRLSPPRQHGDVFGVSQILRDPGTAPISSAGSGQTASYGWDTVRLLIAATSAFIRYTCDPLDPTASFYFSRLNASRTRERNNRMHFDEVINSINGGLGGWGGCGRQLFFDCTVPGEPRPASIQD
jgi:hypothetical protein